MSHRFQYIVTVLA